MRSLSTRPRSSQGLFYGSPNDMCPTITASNEKPPENAFPYGNIVSGGYKRERWGFTLQPGRSALV